MTDPALRIACAEACGYVRIPETTIEYMWRPGAMTTGKATWQLGSTMLLEGWLPNYPQDLNACAQLRATLNELEKSQYVSRLGDVLIESGLISISSFDYLNATARQHCIAFLKVKGRWQAGGGEQL